MANLKRGGIQISVWNILMLVLVLIALATLGMIIKNMIDKALAP